MNQLAVTLRALRNACMFAWLVWLRWSSSEPGMGHMHASCAVSRLLGAVTPTRMWQAACWVC